MTDMTSRFHAPDPVSQSVLRDFALKLAFIVIIAGPFALLEIHRPALTCILLQTQCILSCAMSVAAAMTSRQPPNAPSLTYWDEAASFSGIAVLAHIGAGLLA